MLYGRHQLRGQGGLHAYIHAQTWGIAETITHRALFLCGIAVVASEVMALWGDGGMALSYGVMAVWP